MAGLEVIVLERADAIGTETSSRNSEVIHAGIYYRAGSLKARFCIAGKQFLYRYCAERGVAHVRCGKLIVATDEAASGEAGNDPGQRAGRWACPISSCWSAEQAVGAGAGLALHGGAVVADDRGVDSHGLMLAYQGDAESHGAMIAFESPLERAEVTPDGHRPGGRRRRADALLARQVVNSAGLHAPALARRFAGRTAAPPTAYYCKGNYYTLAGRSPFARLIYPVPEQAGLGVHVTVDLAGQCRFGPDTEWIDDIDYDGRSGPGRRFYAEVRKYWPGLPDGALGAGLCR